MSASPEKSLQLKDLVKAIFRHKRKIGAWCALALGLSVVMLAILPRKYGSEAKVFMRLGRENLALDPTITAGTSMMQVQDSREIQINSIRDMMMSRSLLEAVTEKLGPDVILNGPSDSGEKSWLSSLFGLIKEVPLPSLSPALSPSEQAIKKLNKSMSISIARNSSVVDVVFFAKTPELAQRLVTTFLDVYDEQHLTANRTAGSVRFFSEQSAELKRQLDAANQKLRGAKDESKLVSVEAEQKALQEQVSQVESATLATDAALASSEASNAQLRESLANLPETVPISETSGLPNQAADYMRQELYKLQISMRELESKLGEGHPVVKTVREQVRSSEAILQKQPDHRTQTTAGVNPARQALELDLRRGEVLVASLHSKLGTLKNQLAVLNERTRSLNEQEVLIADLDRNAEIAASNYRNYVDHLEQARIGEALESNRISNVNIVQTPSLVFEAVSPKPRIVLGIGVAAALLGSLAIVFGYEYLDRTLKDADEVEQCLNIPVFVTIPQAEQEHVLHEKPSWANATHS